MTTLQTYQDQQPVVGVYCGVVFSGKLDCSNEWGCRPTPDYRNTIFQINLDTPINVFGQERTRIIIWSNGDDEVRAA